MKAVLDINLRFYDVLPAQILELLKIVTPMHIKLVSIGDCNMEEREEIYKLLNITTKQINELEKKAKKEKWTENFYFPIFYYVKKKKLKELTELIYSGENKNGKEKNGKDNK